MFQLTDVRKVARRQSFRDWSLDEAAPEGGCLHLVGLLHTKNNDALKGPQVAYRMFGLPDTIVLHRGMPSAWFFVSPNRAEVRCKNRASIKVDRIVRHFAALVNEPNLKSRMQQQQPQTNCKKVALAFQSAQFQPTYLDEAELRYFVGHRARMTESGKPQLVLALGPYAGEEFSIIRATWMAGHFVAEGKKWCGEEGLYVAPETRMRGLDAVLCSRELQSKGCAEEIILRELEERFPDVAEAWVSGKVFQRVSETCKSLVQHLDLVSPEFRMKKLEVVFRLGIHNQISLLFPLSVERQSSKVPKHLVEKVAQPGYLTIAARDSEDSDLSGALSPFPGEARLKVDDHNKEQAARQSEHDPIESRWQDEEEGGSAGGGGGTNGNGSRKSKDDSLRRVSTTALDGNLSLARSLRKEESIRSASIVALPGRLSVLVSRKPMPPGCARPAKENPVKRLLQAYGSSRETHRRMADWYSEWSRRQQQARCEGGAPKARIPSSDEHSSFLKEIKQRVSEQLQTNEPSSVAAEAPPVDLAVLNTEENQLVRELVEKKSPC